MSQRRDLLLGVLSFVLRSGSSGLAQYDVPCFSVPQWQLSFGTTPCALLLGSLLVVPVTLFFPASTMSLNLFYDPTALQALSFLFGGEFSYSRAQWETSRPFFDSYATFTNGLAAGFTIDYGIVLTTNSIKSENAADVDVNPVMSEGRRSYTKLDFVRQGAHQSTVAAAWCSCEQERPEGSFYDFADLYSGDGTEQLYQYADPESSYPLNTPMPMGQLNGVRRPNCRCSSTPAAYTFRTSPQQAVYQAGDRDGNSFLFVGPQNLPLLASTTTTEYVATTTSTPPAPSIVSTTTSTTPSAVATTTETPAGPTVTTVPITTSTVSVAGATVNFTPPASTVTNTAKPTCTVYNLSFAKDCCPRTQIRKGAPKVLLSPRATPAAQLALAPRQQPNPDSDPVPSATVRSQTLYVTEFRTSTVTAATPPAVVTSTSTVYEASSITATVTAATPAAVTVADSTTSTTTTSVTAAETTSTFVAQTQTITVPAAACTQVDVPKFTCPRGVRSQNKLKALTKIFLDAYKRRTSRRAPQLAVRCDGDPQVYNY